MPNKTSIAIIICTTGIRSTFYNYLKSISTQTKLPQHVIIVERVDKEPRLNLSKIKQILNSKVKLTHKKIYQGNIAYSRNEGLKEVSEDIVLFLDDDILIEKEYIKKLLKLYLDNPSQNIIVGKIVPVKNQFWQVFTNKLVTGLKNDNIRQTVITWPAMNLSFRKEINTNFDENFTALEDFAFCYQLKKLKFTINYYPELRATHLYISNIFSFIKKFYFYYKKNILLLLKTFPQDSFYHPIKFDKYSIKTYVNLFFEFIKENKNLRKNLDLSLKYILPCTIYFLILYKSVYFEKSNLKNPYRLNGTNKWHF